ncbi:diaminopimelate decarboxylase [Cytobacillus praedii]|uniref:diaminopimelate decarboxylase n=1 Tax=Cytobacillus praedii TaxID=1742358 RepID=UPI003F7DF3AB
MKNTYSNERIQDLIEKYGSPLYLYNSETILNQIKKIKNNLHASLDLFYSLKANPNPTIASFMYSKDVNLEISSGYELDVAKRINADPGRILFLGPGKTKKELFEAIKYGVKYIVAESLQEIFIINDIAEGLNKIIDIGIRINPNYAVSGARLKMGGTAKQFGIDEAQFSQIHEVVKQLKHVEVVGIHIYHGTRILSAESIAENFKYIINFSQKVIDKLGLKLKYVGLGGGFGIPYYKGEEELDIKLLGQLTNKKFENFLDRYKGIKLLIESGRFLVAESGLYLSKVLYTKKSQGVNFAIVDGGTHHFSPNGGSTIPFLTRNFPMHVFSESKNKKTYNISGCLCTPNDLIAKGIELPLLFPGSIIGIEKAGAYGLTSSPILFLSHALPQEVIIKDNKDFLIRNNLEYFLPKINPLRR